MVQKQYRQFKTLFMQKFLKNPIVLNAGYPSFCFEANEIVVCGRLGHLQEQNQEKLFLMLLLQPCENFPARGRQVPAATSFYSIWILEGSE